jgi:predicted TIM-barrel fold metal-dependent hydrolase
MPIDIDRFIFIDNHAHSLISGHLQFDAISFRKAFSESRSLSIIQNHVASSVFYMDLLTKLGNFHDVEPAEESIFEARSAEREIDYVRDLWDDVSIAGLILDDGYRSADMLTIRQLAELCGRPVYRCVRIESVIEDSINGANNFDELKSIFELAMEGDDSAPRVVAWKSIAAYRGGLGIEHIDDNFARADLDRVKQLFDDGDTRIEAGALYHWLLMRAFEWAAQKSIPVQLHCGIGDDDADLRTANPLCLRPILRDKRFAKTTFVLLHSYPFVKEAAYLCSLYPNVYMDLSLACTLAAPFVDFSYMEALAMAPTTKILAGTDGHTVPESHWYGALSTKRSLGNALSKLIFDGSLHERNAADVAARILHENARELYALEDLL